MLPTAESDGTTSVDAYKPDQKISNCSVKSNLFIHLKVIK